MAALKCASKGPSSDAAATAPLPDLSSYDKRRRGVYIGSELCEAWMRMCGWVGVGQEGKSRARRTEPAVSVFSLPFQALVVPVPKPHEFLFYHSRRVPIIVKVRTHRDGWKHSFLSPGAHTYK